ncbi:MAG TPA: AraC family transcriptional regulator [Candidatus Binatia bacterium]|nr:AraC family transcriptional regulator [Candidatus Binatia bacterium]
MDPLSDVLRAVRLTGAVFFRVDATSPWVIEMPDTSALASVTLPRAQHVISYHVVTHGSCWGMRLEGAPVKLEAGDVLVFPHGDPYVMSMAPGMRGGPDIAEVLAFMKEMVAGRLPFAVAEGGGGPEQMSLVCGFLGCDVHPFNPLLAALPRLLHVRQAFAPGDPLAQLIDFAIAESRERRAGGECVRLRLSELMFVEVVRRHLAALPPGQTGWVAGLRDRIIGRALALLHERPAEAWTLEKLARDVGLSRSALAQRFTYFVGDAPMQYLTRWRMQAAARLLTDGQAKVSAVALAVGYDSEAAFSRAFKKAAGMPPAAWRRGHATPPASRETSGAG